MHKYAKLTQVNYNADHSNTRVVRKHGTPCLSLSLTALLKRLLPLSFVLGELFRANLVSLLSREPFREATSR